MLTIGLLFAYLFYPSLSHSNEQDKPSEEIAVVGNRIASSTQDLGGSISVIDSQQLDNLSSTHIQEALRSVAGVNYQRGNGQESLPSIRSAVLTGAGACGNTLILEEGITVRAAGFCNVNELFDTHFEQAGQIEVLRGAQSAFYGSNGLTGSINVILPNSGKNELSLELGSDSYQRVKGALSYGSGKHSGRAYLTLTDNGGFRDNSGYQQQKLSLRHVYSGENLRIAAGLTVTDLDQQTAGFIVGLDSYRDPVLVRENLDPEAFRDTQSRRAWAKFDWALNENQQFQFVPYLRSSEMTFALHFLPGDPIEENKQHGVGWQSSLTTSFANGIKWSIGLDGEVGEGQLFQFQDLPTQGSDFLQETIPTGVQYDYQVQTSQLAVFSHLNWQFNDSLRLIAGVRAEWLEFDYDNLSLNGRTRDDGTECGFGGCRYSRPGDSKDSFSHISPKVELHYQLDENLVLRASIADSFRAPQATELYRLQEDQVVANLDTVKAASVELGAKWQSPNTILDIAFYHIDQDNLIIRDSDLFNIDGQSSKSVGLELTYKHAINERWSVQSVWTFAKHEYTSNPNADTQIDGNTIDTAPSAYGNVSLSWNANSKLSTELEVNHVSDYFLDIENKYEYPGHTLLHARASYALSDGVNVSLRVNNLTNKRYAERADFTTFTQERYFPGLPRSVFGTIKWQF